MSVTQYADAPAGPRAPDDEFDDARLSSAEMLGLLSWINRVDLAARYPRWENARERRDDPDAPR